jgi:hypothetical protein
VFWEKGLLERGFCGDVVVNWLVKRGVVAAIFWKLKTCHEV